MQRFSFDCRGGTEIVVGLIKADSEKDAKNKIKAHYKNSSCSDLEVEEFTFNGDIAEIYYGGC